MCEVSKAACPEAYTLRSALALLAMAVYWSLFSWLAAMLGFAGPCWRFLPCAGQDPGFSLQKTHKFFGNFVSFFSQKWGIIPFRGWGSKSRVKKAKFAREEKRNAAKTAEHGKEADGR